MLSEVSKTLDEFIRSTKKSCKVRNTYDKQNAGCQTFYLGSLIQALNAKGFYPVPDPATYKGSLCDCRRHLLECVTNMQLLSWARSNGHDQCSPSTMIASGLAAILPNIPLTEAEEEHLSEQALRSGLSVQAQYM